MPSCSHCEMGYQISLNFECVDCAPNFILAGTISELQNKVPSYGCVMLAEEILTGECYFFEN